MTSAPPSGRKRKIYYDRQQQIDASLYLRRRSITSAVLALLGLARCVGPGHGSTIEEFIQLFTITSFFKPPHYLVI